jgi:cyclopropane-fatty-acyl-phospholipid synthase
MSQLDESSPVSMDIGSGTDSPGLAGRLLDRLTRNVHAGRLRIVLPSGVLIEKVGTHPGPDSMIVMRRWRALRRIVTAGDIGFAESFLDEDWTTPDLTALIRFAAVNRDALSAAIDGSLVMRFVNRIGHLLNANTKRGSRRNIEAHYDLGNDFYKEWLDPSMLYSSAIFDASTPTLEAAQQKKLERIAEKLALTGGESVLEIGCGWGALAMHLAQNARARVTGITLSPSQLAWARDAVDRQGFAGSVDLRLQDYRDTDGQFDRIVSIEMFEAVGEAYWPSYFDTLKRCLKPGGRAVLQIISIEEQRFDSYRRSTDFIQKYIFPGGFLPSDPALQAAVERAGLALKGTEHFGESYAMTLADWRTRFQARWSAVAALGFDDRFRRLWEYYLCYCEAGFRQGSINVGFYTIEHA